MPVIFTIFNFLIRMKSSSVSRRELANFQTGAQADDEEKILFCSKVQAYILIFGIVVIPISLAIALLIADPGSLAYSTFLSSF